MRTRTLLACLAAALASGAISIAFAADPPPRTTVPHGAPETMPPREGREDRDPDRMRSRRPFSPEQMTEVVEFTKKYFPELHEQIEQVRKDDPARAGMLMRHIYRLWAEVRFYPDEVRTAAIERHKLNVAIFQARREYLDAKTDADKQRVLPKLRELLGKQFEQDAIVKQYEIKRIEKQLADLKASVAQYEQDRDKIIEERLKKLTEPPPPLPPGPPPGPGDGPAQK